MGWLVMVVGSFSMVSYFQLQFQIQKRAHVACGTANGFVTLTMTNEPEQWQQWQQQQQQQWNERLVRQGGCWALSPALMRWLTVVGPLHSAQAGLTLL